MLAAELAAVCAELDASRARQSALADNVESARKKTQELASRVTNSAHALATLSQETSALGAAVKVEIARLAELRRRDEALDAKYQLSK